MSIIELAKDILKTDNREKILLNIDHALSPQEEYFTHLLIRLRN